MGIALLERGVPSTALNLADARQVMADHRQAFGLSGVAVPLLTDPSGNVKTAKTKERKAYILHLSPANVGGVGNVCKYSTKGCRAACLNTAGKGAFDYVQRARIWRTQFLNDNPVEFLFIISQEIQAAVKKHGGEEKIAVRLNGTSDLRWELIAPWLMDRFPGVQFYDYTKWPTAKREILPANYHLTYSVSERDAKQGDTWVDDLRVAVVVVDVPKSQDFPERYRGLTVVDGDKTDARWLDEAGSVVLLRPKGRARKETSGFVRNDVTGVG
jgi:hypothetical protein